MDEVILWVADCTMVALESLYILPCRSLNQVSHACPASLINIQILILALTSRRSRIPVFLFQTILVTCDLPSFKWSRQFCSTTSMQGGNTSKSQAPWAWYCKY